MLSLLAAFSFKVVSQKLWQTVFLIGSCFWRVLSHGKKLIPKATIRAFFPNCCCEEFWSNVCSKVLNNFYHFFSQVFYRCAHIAFAVILLQSTCPLFSTTCDSHIVFECWRWCDYSLLTSHTNNARISEETATAGRLGNRAADKSNYTCTTTADYSCVSYEIQK